MKFYFCETCGKRVTDADVEAGQARNKKLKGVYCSDCAIGVMTMETLPVSEQQARKILGKHSTDTPLPSNALSGKPRRESGIVQLAGIRKPGESTAPLRTKQSAGTPLQVSPKSSMPVAVFAGLLIALVLGSLLLFTGGEKPKAETGKKIPVAAGTTIANVPSQMPSVARKMTMPPAEIGKSVPTIEKSARTPAASKEETPVAKTVGEPQQLAEPPPAPKQEEPSTLITAKVEDDRSQIQFSDVLKQLAPLLRNNQFIDAEKLLDEKLRNPELAGISSRLKSEKADLAEIRALRLRTLDALRAKNGSTITLTLRGAKVTGTVKADPKHTDVALALRDGPEFVIKADQLDVQDADAYAPVEPGGANAEDLRRRGLLFMAAGEAAKAEDYFSKARDAGLGDAAAIYLNRIVALKLGEKEVRASEAWKKAESMFASKNWQSAKLAYETFQRDYTGSAALENNVETIKKRLEAIEDALGPPREIGLDLGGGLKMEMVLIPAGEFDMGSNDGVKNEKPVHKVKISRSFYMGKYVVTQAQYEKVMGSNSSATIGESLPVEQVTYAEADEFCKKESKLAGMSIRLPTEAEWEYACRAGTRTKYNTGDNDAALEQAGWFKGNAEGKTHPVGLKKPNAWGLYDMHGNVWQWCQDWFGEDYYGKSGAENPQGPEQGTQRVLRSGSWYNFVPMDCRSASRIEMDPGARFGFIGFRIVAVPASKTP